MNIQTRRLLGAFFASLVLTACGDAAYEDSALVSDEPEPQPAVYNNTTATFPPYEPACAGGEVRAGRDDACVRAGIYDVAFIAENTLWLGRSDATLEPIALAELEAEDITHFASSPSGGVLTWTAGDGSVTILDPVHDTKVTLQLPALASGPAPAWSRRDQQLAVVTPRSNGPMHDVTVLNIATGDLRIVDATTYASACAAPAWDDGGELLYPTEGAVRSFDPEDGERKITSNVGRAPCHLIADPTGGARLTAQDADGVVSLVRVPLDERGEVEVLSSMEDVTEQRMATWARDASRFAYVAEVGEGFALQILDVASPADAITLPLGDAHPSDISFGSDGERVMITTPDEQVRIVDLRVKEQASVRPMALQGVRHITWARVRLK